MSINFDPTPSVGELPPLEDGANPIDNVHVVEVGKNAKNAAGLPEAGGVIWVNVYTPNGAKVSLTARGNNMEAAVVDLLLTLNNEQLMADVFAAVDRYKPAVNTVASTVASGTSGTSGTAAGAMVSAAQAQGGQVARDIYIGEDGNKYERFTVTDAFFFTAKNGNRYVKVKGGVYTKYGIMVFSKNPKIETEADLRALIGMTAIAKFGEPTKWNKNGQYADNVIAFEFDTGA